MTSPKHLWSGDWEQSSTEPPQAAPFSPTPAAPGPPEPPSGAPAPSGWRGRRTAVVGAVVVLVIAGVALAFGLGGTSHPRNRPQQQAQAQSPGAGGTSGGAPLQSQTAPQQAAPTQTAPQLATPTQTTSAPVEVGPTYEWLGLELIDSTTGVTVETIKINSAADTAGVNPGDVITSVNHTTTGSVAALVKAVASLKLGQQVQLTVNRGTTQVTLAATLTDLPAKQP